MTRFRYLPSAEAANVVRPSSPTESVPGSDSLNGLSFDPACSAAAIAQVGSSFAPAAFQASAIGCAGAQASSFPIADAGSSTPSPTSFGTTTTGVGHSAN